MSAEEVDSPRYRYGNSFRGGMQAKARDIIAGLFFLSVFLVVLISCASCFAYTMGVCSFESPEDAAAAINDAIMNNPGKYNAIDVNSNGTADSLEYWNHAMYSGGNSQFGNYMCSEFAALSLCVLQQEFNCSPNDVQMVVGVPKYPVGENPLHAVTGFRNGVIKGVVDGYQIDFSSSDKFGQNIPNPGNFGDKVPIRDGLYNVAPAECAQGYSVMQGNGYAMPTGAFGSGNSMGQQVLLSAMMGQLMSRMGMLNQLRTPGMQRLFDAMQRNMQGAASPNNSDNLIAPSQPTAAPIASYPVNTTPVNSNSLDAKPTTSDMVNFSGTPSLSDDTVQASELGGVDWNAPGIGTEIKLQPDPAVQ